MLNLKYLSLVLIIVFLISLFLFYIIKSFLHKKILKLPPPYYQKFDNIETKNKLKILAVISEQGILDSLDIFFKKSGYYFVGTPNPILALNNLKQEHFDILIFDYTTSLQYERNIIEEIRDIDNDLYILLLTNNNHITPSYDFIKKFNIQGYCEKWNDFNQLILLIESGINYVNQLNRIKDINNNLVNTNQQLEQSYLDSIQLLRHTVEAKDSYTKGHSDRVSLYSVLIGKKLGLSDEDLKKLEIGGLFHDIGKIGIPDSILQKNGRLSKYEYSIIKKHPEIGANILSTASIFQDIIPIVKYHHERYDGKGYPERLSGKKIPYLARITAVADTFDAMTSKRSYRDALPLDCVISEIQRCKGSQFDPKIAEAFIEILKNEFDVIKDIQEMKL